MKKLAFALIASLTLASQAALATPYTEQPDHSDAGSLPGTAQTIGSGVTSISGSTGTDGDTEDLFRFTWDGGLFQAATNGDLGSTITFDTMLFLFDGSGNFITANDDAPYPGSFISATLTAGDYLLGISGWSNDALNGSGSAFRFGATGTLTSWEGGGSTGRYTIGLNAATGGTVPEPAPLALLALGLGAIAIGRRGKRV
jgi:hypothetical protein